MTARRLETRDSYPHFLAIQTRWMDNDVYGHVNNVVYYAYFDTVVNRYLIDAGGLDIHNGRVIGLVVATSCAYFASVAFPDRISAGLRVVHIGTSSVGYQVGLFRNDDPTPSAAGDFTHVYVDRATMRPTPLSGPLRDCLEAIRVSPPS